MSTPKSQMLTLFSNAIKYQIFPLLDEKSLCLFSQLSKRCRDLSASTRADRKKATELIFCVLNPSEANLKRMEELLSEAQAETQSIIFIRVAGKEVYFSKNQNKILLRPNRVWPHPMSSLEAAFKCGDFHLVQRLVGKVPGNQRGQALEQLQNVRAKCTPNEPGNFLYDLGSLYKAYEDFNVSSERYFINDDDIKRLSDYLGEAQKNLSWFLLQVFCNPVPHYPIPDFTKEPRRLCLLWDRSELDLDSIGSVSSFVLYKGRSYWGDLAEARVGKLMLAGVNTLPDLCGALDAINSLCEVLPQELDKIIKSLADAALERRVGPRW